MKQQSLFKALSITFALLLSLPVMAQGVIVHKKDGTKVKYSYEVLDRIETYNYDDEVPEENTESGEFNVNGVTFTMIAVEGGTFTMGATSEQGSDAYDDESPVHQVTLSDFYIGKYEVTQGLWEAVMSYTGGCADGSSMSAYSSDVWLGSNPSSAYGVGANYPAYYVSHDDIVNIFLPRLNKITGKTFRLPTEAEWEYAARGGNKSAGYKYSGSNTVGDVAWYTNNSSTKTHEVGTKQPNELGIYDMSGNVWEWCSDWYGSYSSSSQTDPTGPSTGSSRVLRGGWWFDGAGICRVSYRADRTPSGRGISSGFRLVLVP
ncbi:MAG: formylglycine-generating enzyme family protein [Muribaculaceae bacterium]|nr:formylglycine-generating enzyme family protein [Muribaculaceae bacterium]